jgi:hypothetical protein
MEVAEFVTEKNWAELLPTAEAARALGMTPDELRRLEKKYQGTDLAIPALRITLDETQADVLGCKKGPAVLYPQQVGLLEWRSALELSEETSKDTLKVGGEVKISPVGFHDLELNTSQKRNLGILTHRLQCEIEEVLPIILDHDPSEIAAVAMSEGGGHIKLHLPPMVISQIENVARSQGVTPQDWIVNLLKMTRGAGIVFVV